MVLIPNDVGVRMRMQTETSLHPIAPISEIPADLPELRPGQAFSARIQEVLPENTYKALVAGRSLTLALPEGAKAGDTLELVVVDRTPRLIVAQLANRNGPGAAAAAGGGYEFASLSHAARLIGALLARDGAPPPPAALTRGQALLAAATTDTAKLAAELAPQLAKAVSQSGLFYEAHQVQWVMGRRPLGDLLVEPQANHSAAENPAAPGQEAGGSATRATAGGRPAEPSGPMVLLQNLFGSEEARQQTSEQSTTTTTTANPARAVPEDLRPLVQQQLDAVATQRLAWHGEVWPGQSLNWQIEPDDQRAGNEQADSERGWITSLRLVTPRLGEIDARLNLTPQGVRITLATPMGASAADLLDAAPSLERSLAAADVPLLALQVKHDTQE
ncbi:MAG: flagellar hook-length control protein FliK [Sulfuritalea sp.]|nr:flagellar hook-length control protein FliK [Sulfuritalea sp.]